MQKLNNKASINEPEETFVSSLASNSAIKDPESINHKRKRSKLTPVLQKTLLRKTSRQTMEQGLSIYNTYLTNAHYY